MLDMDEIETLNIELEHRVTKLVAENEHLKQTYKQLYDSIKPKRVQSKEQCDALIKQVNIKVMGKIYDLNCKTSEQGVRLSTCASGSQPSGNTRNDRIQQTPSSNSKNKVEAHPRNVKSSLNKRNGTVKVNGSASVQNSKKHDNSDYVCINGDDCMSSDNLCVSNSMNDVKFRAKPKKSKSKKNKSKKDIWKPTGKVFTKIGYIWRPTDYPIWEVIQNGNGPVSVTLDTTGQIKILPPKTAEEMVLRERERKARTTLLMAIPEDHLAKFHKMTDAKDMWIAIKSRLVGNDIVDRIQKMQKYILKQQFEGFTVSNSDGIHKGYERFQSLLSQLEIHGAGVSTEDANQNFLRSLPSAWLQFFDHEEQTRNGQSYLITWHFARECRTKEENRRRDGWNTGNREGRRTRNRDESITGKKEESRALVTVDGEFPPHGQGFIASGPDVEIDDSKYTYGPEKTQPSEPDSQTNEVDACDSNISTETSELVFDTPVFATKHVKTPSENVKNNSTYSQKPKVNNKQLEKGITERACFVCGSLSHLIRDCDYHVKLAKQVKLHKQNMSKGNGSREKTNKILRKPIWDNAQRVNKQHQFVPLAVQTRTGTDPVNTVKASGTNYENQQNLKNKGIIDSGCSRHMTGNKAYLADYQDINGGPVAFGGSRGYITGKGKIQTGKLDFEDVSFVKELQHFNLFSVSQMCDKMNKVLFTDTECLILSPDFKLPDENQILLKVPRQNNMYSFNLENIVPLGGLACLIAKATTDESNLWHRRLGHVNFKNLNRLVKGNLVRGLPTKLFQNDHTCVACQKGKQHKASCKAKLVSSISHTLQLLHMDLFGPTSIRSINHKTYCLVITDDFSRFSWTFFLRTKDETSAILKDFIRQIENQLNQKVKTIRCDNGTEFKNRDIIEFCGLKGIKREYSNARTPQQNGVAERKNRTLIEAARTMLADSFLPNTFWAEAVSTACYVLNRVLVTKPHNKTPYELLLGKGPIGLFDLDYLTDSMNYLSVSSENQANIHAGQQETNQNEGSKDKIVAGDSDKEDESAQDCFEVPYGHFFLDDLARLQRQGKKLIEEAEALTRILEQTLNIPVGTASANEGLSLSNTTNSQEDDYEIPPLEDIHEDATDGIFTHSSYDDEGAVADFTNLGNYCEMLVLFPHQYGDFPSQNQEMDWLEPIVANSF
ncbi:putative ribonuclease H-like domain-containing protein [Tanacetum coccineum]